VSLGYPIFLDLSQRLIVIVGGGVVAARKATGALAAGATRVRAVSPQFGREFPQNVERIAESFLPRHLEGAGLVFAATDSPQVNQQVVAEARQRAIWVNRADPDEEDPADFTTPALLRCGAITVAISAGGSPALAATLRDLLADSLTDQWVNLADAMTELRRKIKSSGLPIAARKKIFRSLATAEAASILASSGEAGLWEWTRKSFPDLPPIETESPLRPGESGASSGESA
jgi:precorrin-2 dehydrogenase/sirohydrochlorin ferrochelatase